MSTENWNKLYFNYVTLLLFYCVWSLQLKIQNKSVPTSMCGECNLVNLPIKKKKKRKEREKNNITETFPSMSVFIQLLDLRKSLDNSIGFCMFYLKLTMPSSGQKDLLPFNGADSGYK